jgi:hypothetical protein
MPAKRAALSRSIPSIKRQTAAPKVTRMTARQALCLALAGLSSADVQCHCLSRMQQRVVLQVVPTTQIRDTDFKSPRNRVERIPALHRVADGSKG